ncbi:HAD family hydrolase [Anaerosporomusa subterranea]|uniref:HAD family hydrolase n=1 Tax=Anaerosporomusa subterranea TaxID=1794912 RepID=UPI0022B24AC7|nr:HAD hydrolase-like protein [Anaerosporomusa subterranea]
MLFWDIDGTLIKTGKAGLYAFEQATAEIWSQPVDFAQIKTSGMTDFSIAAEIIETVTGRGATPAEVITLAKRYEQLLPNHLDVREGRVLPSIREILDALHQRSDCMSLLLTGNSRLGAELKLRKFGLDHYFNFDNSAFCNCNLTRDEVAAGALAITRSMTTQNIQSVFVIGDTPNDIRCGKDIGAFTLGVATGTYSLQQLRECSPWWAVESLPSAATFMARLEEARS